MTKIFDHQKSNTKKIHIQISTSNLSTSHRKIMKKNSKVASGLNKVYKCLCDNNLTLN